MTHTFKVGDKVRRIKGHHNGMIVGDEAVVLSVTPSGQDIKFSTFTGTGFHDARNFELVEDTSKVSPSNLSTFPLEVGDVLECTKAMPSISKGDTATYLGRSNDGHLRLKGHSGDFTEDRWKFVNRDTELCRKDYREGGGCAAKKGDFVILLDYGWGIGEHCGTPLGVPLEVLKDSDKWHTRVKRPNGESANVENCALRVIKSTNATKEKPMFKKKDLRGHVSDYLDLSKPYTVEAQKAHANKVIRELKRRHTGGVWVCGGAPRNWDADRLANDIDVYLYLPTDKGIIAESLLSTRLGIAPSDIIRLGAENPYKYTGNNIKFVFEVHLGGQEYQFIVTTQPVMDPVVDVLDYFNCDLCRIAYDPITQDIVRTPEYKTDRDFKRLTYRMYKLEEANAKLSMERHVPKMMKQFPDHDVTIMVNDPDAPKESQDDPFRF